MNKKNQLLELFSRIYPIYLMILAFAPLFIGLFIDFQLLNARMFAIQLIWIPIFTIPSVLLNSKIYNRFINSLFFTVGLVELVHWLILKGPISLTSLLVISNTNIQEAMGFIDLKFSSELLLVIPYVIVFIYSLKLVPKRVSFNNSSKILISIIALISIVFILENAVNNRLIRKGVPQIAKVAFSFYEKINLYNEAKKHNSPRDIIVENNSKIQKQTIVVIIGESCNRNHLRLYNYYRNTSPKLSNRNDIIVYDDVVSPYSNTLNSVLTILSESSLDSLVAINNRIDVFDIFHSAAFKTYWLSNQSPIGVWDNMVTVFANKADNTTFVNIASNSSFEATYIKSFDEKLFQPFINALREENDKKLIILHLMGSHSTYSKRYPNRFNVFDGESKKDKIIADYDNSILYNDFIVDSLFNIMKSFSNNDETSVAIYLSDHGENVYDEQDRVGHDFSKILPKSNVEIPFIIWLSESYKAINSQKYRIIKNNKSRPYVSDDLFHSLLDISFIKTKAYKPNRSIFSENNNRKRILEDGKDYDRENTSPLNN